MRIMSKNNRLPERPKPPSWTQIVEDMDRATEDDVVFSMGKDNLPSQAFTTVYSPEKSLSSSNDNFSSSSPNVSDQDLSQYDPEKVATSYSSVLKMITLYTELKDSPSHLQEQYSHLKDLGQEMTQSISELKALALNINADSSHKTSSSPSSGNRNESKRKRKKKT